MRIGSLFSGAGMLDKAVEHVFGGETVWHCENSPAASKVLEVRWPGVPNYGDITQIDWDTAEPVDILCGGYPCQPFSQAGKRRGAKDDRHIWPYVREAIRRIRPRYTVLENVSGHRSMGFDRVLGDLAEDGMHVRWTSLRAADVGAPHGRERLFFIVTPADTSGDGFFRNAQNGAKTPEQVAKVGHSPANLNETVRNYLAAPKPDDDQLVLLATPQARDRRGSPSDGFNQSCLCRDVLELAEHGWGKYEPAVRRWEALTRPAPAPAEPSTNGKPRVRSEFSEWMMGWPEGWVTDIPGLSRTDKLVAIGNGVVPAQAAAALSWLLSLEAVA